jgi:ABC-type branched-subunit amino acid transport system ATPase component
MLSLAAVLMMRPQCLLLDEPTSDLAPAMIGLIFEKIRDIIHEYHIPVLLVEQNVQQALGVADRVLVLIRGRPRLSGFARDLSEPQLGEVFLET